ncbi:MAG: hypothetical protein ACRDJE_11145 [Dehalococcoidia bacterium]
MTNEQTVTVVLKDAAGSYFLVPQAVLEQGRVPAEHVAELEQAIAAGGSDGDDVQGHLLAFFIGVGIGYFGTKAIIEGTRDEPGKTVGESHAEMLGIGRGITGR